MPTYVASGALFALILCGMGALFLWDKGCADTTKAVQSSMVVTTKKKTEAVQSPTADTTKAAQSSKVVHKPAVPPAIQGQQPVTQPSTALRDNENLLQQRGGDLPVEIARRNNIPAAACTTYTWRYPESCDRGNEYWHRDQLRAALPSFAKMYSTRPISYNRHGQGANHLFALWYTIGQLKPKHVVESGVLYGQTTWLIRQAAGANAHVYSYDPSPETQLKFRDTSEKTHYYMGEKWVDLGEVDWDTIIPRDERHQTLFMLDDHQSVIKRVKQLHAAGFIHIWYDDNYHSLGKARKDIKDKGVDNLSFNFICSPLDSEVTNVRHQDSHGKEFRDVPLKEHLQMTAEIIKLIDVYFEFPAILDTCGRFKQPLLLRESDVAALGLPSVKDDRGHYQTQFPPYVRLYPDVART